MKTTTAPASNSMSTRRRRRLAPVPLRFLAALALALTVPARAQTFTDADWVSLDPGMPGANGSVTAMAVDGNGNVYVGGNFTFIGTVFANYIAKWDGSAWSALGSGMDSPVFELAVSGNNLYAAGDFATAGGAPANVIAKWDGSAWSALGSGFSDRNDSVLALAVIGTDLYAGGTFTNAGGIAANYIAKWDGSAWSALGSGMDQNVSALAVSGTNLYAGGSFTNAGGVMANRIARWDGSAWSALGSGVIGGLDPSACQVCSLAVNGTNLYAGGYFTTAGAAPANNIAQWNGRAWSALGKGITGGSDGDCVSALAVSGNSLYAAGGYFTNAGGRSANNIAKWDGSVWWTLGSGLDGWVYALAVSGTNLYAGGQINTAGGLPANSIAIWDGSAWSAWGSGMGGSNPEIEALVVSGINLYAGGIFSTAGGLTANSMAKWDGSAWSAFGSGMDYEVRALAVSGTNLYAGGIFRTAGGLPANNIAKWDDRAWSALGSGAGGSSSTPSVCALAASGDNIYAGGYFTNAGGVQANCIAKWNGNGWGALGAGMTYPNGAWWPCVSALAVSGTDLYAGGMFTTAGGGAANNIAKWDGSTWSALGSGIAGNFNNTCVYALAVSGTDLYAGGQFTTAGGLPANNIAKWDGSTWSALGSGVGGCSNPNI